MMKILAKTKKDLQWDDILKRWSDSCSSELGKNLVYSIWFSENKIEADFRKNIIDELISNEKEGIGFRVGELQNLDPVLKRLEMGGSIKAISLSLIIKQLRVTKEIKKKINSVDSENLSEFLKNLDPINHLRSLLEDSIDEEGDIKPGASSELFGLKQRRVIIYNDISKNMEKMMTNQEIEPYLQDNYFTHREKRFVLPIKSEFRGKVDGIIHGTSTSGLTVYMEPTKVFASNNRLKEIESDIEIEELKILAELARSVSDETGTIRNNQKILSKVDLWQGAADFCKKLDCNPVKWSENRKIEIIDGKHPILLLEGVEVIPNTVKMESGKTMIITGPNAGGKTVAIKTVGIIALMAHMGLHITCLPGSEIPFFDNIHTMIGDDQDISTHLSTFSAQIDHLNKILSKSKENHLVLLDELVAGTDPTQGSVLAQSILEYLSKKEVTTFCTTHFSRLKALAMFDENFINGSVGGEALNPDYKLVIGLPGTSSGISVASNLGMENSIIKRANDLLGSGDNKIDFLLSELLNKKKDLFDREREINLEIIKVQQEKDRILNIKAQKERELRKIKKEGYEKISIDLTRVRRLLGHIEDQAKKSDGNREQIRDLGGSLKKVSEKINQVMDDYKGVAADISVIKPGAKIYSRSLGQVVEILELPSKGKVSAQLGTFKTIVSIEDLEIPEQNRIKKLKISSKPQPVKEIKKVENSKVEVIMTPTNTIDIRGKRVDESLDLVEKHLDALLLTGDNGCIVIHGHGLGALKSSVREFMRNSPYIKRFRPGEKGEGGDGVTVGLII
jgi:DNA mismatch repair protein MutS2